MARLHGETYVSVLHGTSHHHHAGDALVSQHFRYHHQVIIINIVEVDNIVHWFCASAINDRFPTSHVGWR